MNFNLIENQRFATRLEPGFALVKLFYYHPIIQYFIYNRNFGCVKYKDRIYNLNRDQESWDMLQLLQEEGFLVITREIPIKKEACRYTVKVIHPEYSFLGTIQVMYLWGSLINRYLDQLSQDEIDEIDEINDQAIREGFLPITREMEKK